MKIIPLTQGKVALVDDEDFDRVNQFKWYADKSGRNWYAKRNIQKDGKRTKLGMHQVILPGVKEVDHKDGDGLHNCKSNLRESTHAQNCFNTKKQAGVSSRFKGVCLRNDCRKWQATIKSTQKQIYLGLFDTEEDAARAYDAKARELFGEFASPNFPLCV